MYKHKFSLLSLIILLMGSYLFGESLYIYYPSVVKSNVVQSKLAASANGITVMVFGKYRDFAMKSAMDKPDVVLTKGSDLTGLDGYSVQYKASRNGSTTEKYVLLSVNDPIDLSSIAPTTVVGVVDIGQRNVMNTMVKELIGKSVKVKHVTKVEDLLPLLTFKMAQAVVVAKDNVSFFKKKSQLNFVETPLPSKGSVGIIASKNGETVAVELAKKVPQLVPTFMGSVQWKK